MFYKLSKTRERRTRDLTDIAYIKDSNGTILGDEDEIKARWKESFETLLNVENEREELEPTDPVQGPIPSVNDTGIRKQLSKMGRNKACGPDDLPIEAVMVVAEMKPELLTYVLQRTMADGIPDTWKNSKLIPIFKNKGDILECNNYRGIKLMSHFMKLWERVIEARLREIVNIRENHFAFRPGMSTTEPVFALRQLHSLERYGRRSFSVAGPSLWNALPSAIRNSYVSTCFQIQSQNSPFSRGVCHSVVAVL